MCDDSPRICKNRFILRFLNTLIVYIMLLEQKFLCLATNELVCDQNSSII